MKSKTEIIDCLDRLLIGHYITPISRRTMRNIRAIVADATDAEVEAALREDGE